MSQWKELLDSNKKAASLLPHSLPPTPVKSGLFTTACEKVKATPRQIVTLRVTPTPPYNMHGHEAVAWREKNTGADAPAASHHCRAPVRTSMSIAGDSAGAIESVRATADADPSKCPRRGRRKFVWAAANVCGPPKMPTAGAGVVWYGKSHRPGLCRTRAISLI